MSDLEIVKACADAMGWVFVNQTEDGPGFGRAAHYTHEGLVVAWQHDYDPLTDDAQAMALVKRFRLDLYDDGGGLWSAWYKAGCGSDSISDLNRAICQCVAALRGTEQ